MAYQANFDTMPPSSVAPRRRWSRGCKEDAVVCGPLCSGLFTLVLVISILYSIDKTHFHARISLQSLAVSSPTWRGDFLVKNPSSRYSIYYDGGDDAAVRLGSQNAAVLNITSERVYKDYTAFSLSFVAEEGNRSGVVSEELDIKLMAKHKRYLGSDEAGFFNIRCKNLTRGREKIVCESSFTYFELFSLIRGRGTIVQIDYPSSRNNHSHLVN